jgi:hypothetical protein
MSNYESLTAKIKELYNDLNQASMSEKLPPSYRSLQNSIGDFIHGRGEFKAVTQDDAVGAGGAFSFDAFNRGESGRKSVPTFVRPTAIGKFGTSSDSFEVKEPKEVHPKVVKKKNVSGEIDPADPADIYANVSSKANNRLQGEVYGRSGTGEDGDFTKFENPTAAREYFMQHFSGKSADHLHFARFLRAFKHRERNMQESFIETLCRYNKKHWL